MENNILKKIEEINKKIKDLETKKIRAEQELKILEKQHSEIVDLLKEEGIDNIDNLPQIIEDLEKEISISLKKLEDEVSKIEQELSLI